MSDALCIILFTAVVAIGFIVRFVMVERRRRAKINESWRKQLLEQERSCAEGIERREKGI